METGFDFADVELDWSDDDILMPSLQEDRDESRFFALLNSTTEQ